MSEALKACSHMHDQFYIITHKHTLSDHYQWFIQTVLTANLQTISAPVQH